jgi:hypothetical protein
MDFDPLAFVIGLIPEVIKYVVIAYALILITRAVAARIAGPNAPLVLNMPLIALPHWQSLGTIDESDEETDNTETAGNTENTTVSTIPAVEYMMTGGLVEHNLIKKITPDEARELREARSNAMGLLSLCCDFYAKANTPDIGIIPRYNKIGIGAQQRQAIIDTLEYSGLVSVMRNSKTIVVPEIKTCAALLKLIRDNRKRVYPLDFCERGQKLLDSAVAALPENEPVKS